MKIGKDTSEKEGNGLPNLLKECEDVSTFTYGELKV